MMAFGHAGSSLGVLHRLQLHLKNWERVRERTGARGVLQPLLEDFENSVLPDLVRLVALSRRAQAKPQHWRPLAERALVVSAEVHELLDVDDSAEEHVRRATAALEQVDVCLAGLRAHLRQVFRAPVGAAVRRALARHQEALAAAGVEVVGRADCPSEHAGFVSPPQLDNVLDNLVDNALRAMAGSAERRLVIGVAPEGAYCCIDVSDTGCGIAAADHERIFDRDYSTREGGGFGLYFARQILARYEGKIFVQHSAPGAGTTLRVLVRSA
jgi:signal transduction histidine kinase